MTDNSIIIFNADIVVKNNDGTAGAGYSLEGVVRQDSGVGSIFMINGTLKTVVGEDVSAWDVSTAVNTSNGNLEIHVLGAAATSLMWFTSMRITRIS